VTQDPKVEARLHAVEDLAYHQARILLLVNAVASSPKSRGRLDGLTKLAKLDFLVRYPALAPIVLDSLRGKEELMELKPNEASAPTEVADPMMRYKYGPWDDRYYAVVGALVSRGLLEYAEGRRGSVALSPTRSGMKFADELIEQEPLWRAVSNRCQAIAQAASGLTGNALKELIYGRLEEHMDRPHREMIT
jgi:hypothetical protein